MQWQYFFLKALSRLLCALPYTMVLRLGAGLGFLHGVFGRSQKRRALKQLQERLGVDAGQASVIAGRMFKNIGRTLLEILYIPALTPAKLERWVSIENLHYLTEAVNAGKGTVLLTAHFGNWEWMAARLVAAGFPLAAVAETQPGQGLDRLLNEYREQVGLKPYARNNTLISAMKALKNGYILGFVADQDAKGSGVFVDFFGRPASTPQGPAFFAQRCGAPVVPAFIVRQPRNKGHRIILSPPIFASDSHDMEQQIQELTARMTEVMENRIRRYPDHWWWFQRRWITNPKTGD